MATLGSAALVASLIALGLAERRARDLARRAVPLRIHVNGTRGKSTVTRLLAGALRAGGIRCLAKTTGTEPRLILPDGSERAIRRRAPASIREQLWAMRQARALGARAVVLECMAVEPELQAVAERDMIRATIGVITNARLDHAEAMGATVEDVAAALALTIPERGTIVVGPTGGADVIAAAARAKGARLVVAAAESAPPGPDVNPGPDAGLGTHPDLGPEAGSRPDWRADNAGIALAVTRLLGIPDDVARSGMREAAPDPGAAQRGAVDAAGRRVEYLDASAANDPESLDRLLTPRTGQALFVFNHRMDRPLRLRQFAEAEPWSRDTDRLVVTGDRPDWLTWRRLRRRLPGGRLAFERPSRLAARLAADLRADAGATLLVFCGNTKGFGREPLLAALRRR